MTLSPEEIADLKNQLKGQIQHLPEDKKAEAIKQIDELSTGALETMLKQQQERQGNQEGPQKTIFRMIIDKDIKSTEVAENDFALAVLDINPISPGHSMIIPKTVVTEADKMPRMAQELAKTLGENIISKLKAKSFDTHTENKFGEFVIHLIPVYDKPLALTSPRQPSKPEELLKIAEKIKVIVKPKVEKIKIKKVKTPPSQILKLPRRIA
ncbi:MAG: HIT family protein, partial [archaeon]